MGTRVWSVVVIDSAGNVDLQRHTTDVHDTAQAYKVVGEKLGPSDSIVAMIPGNHTSGSSTYNLERKRNYGNWVDPFDTPVDTN